MARAGKLQRSVCCAVHDGTIGSFEALSVRLKSIADWREVKVTEREGVNVARIGKIAAGTVAVGLAATGVGVVAAPAIGGTIGGLAGLSGAAATSHGLAVLGGGALAAGGYGMAGGTTVIAVAAGLLGSAGGGVLVNKFVSDIKGFDIREQHRGTGTQVIVVNGFLAQGQSLLQDWRPTLKRHFSRNPWYELDWESKRLRSLGTLALQGAGSAALKKAATQAAKTATRQAAKKLSPGAWLYAVLEVGGNPWLVALSKAQKTGQVLADLIVRADGRRRYILIGHSLGARVIYYALQALAEADIKKPRIQEVHLLGGAVGRDRESWRGIPSAVQGKIHNYYSKRDDVLKILYKVGTLFSSDPIGRAPIELRSRKICNVDVTKYVSGHFQFKPRLQDYICR